MIHKLDYWGYSGCTQEMIWMETFLYEIVNYIQSKLIYPYIGRSEEKISNLTVLIYKSYLIKIISHLQFFHYTFMGGARKYQYFNICETF